ncbi:MAG: cobalamin-dependent protein, partial [Candidatus Hodarchaeales archaeon]
MRKGRSKKVLLLHAPFGKKWKKISSISPPLGLLYLASPLQREGYNVSLIDLNVDHLMKKELMKTFKEQDFVLITCYAGTINNVRKTIKCIKKANSSVIICC